MSAMDFHSLMNHMILATFSVLEMQLSPLGSATLGNYIMQWILKESSKKIPWNRSSRGKGILVSHKALWLGEASRNGKTTLYFRALNRVVFLQNCTKRSFQGSFFRHSFRSGQSLNIKEFKRWNPSPVGMSLTGMSLPSEHGFVHRLKGLPLLIRPLHDNSSFVSLFL